MKSLIALSLALLPATAFAADDSKPAAEQKEEKLVCRVQQSSESRLGRKRVCKTAEQWKAEQDETQQMVDSARRR